MQHDDRDPLADVWTVLGKARRAEPSPFFARNVLRRIREEDGRQGLLASLREWWGARGAGRWIPAASTAVVLLAAIAASRLAPAPGADPFAAGDTDFEVIAELDELLAFDHASVWLDPESVY